MLWSCRAVRMCFEPGGAVLRRDFRLRVVVSGPKSETRNTGNTAPPKNRQHATRATQAQTGRNTGSNGCNGQFCNGRYRKIGNTQHGRWSKAECNTQHTQHHSHQRTCNTHHGNTASNRLSTDATRLRVTVLATSYRSLLQSRNTPHRNDQVQEKSVISLCFCPKPGRNTATRQHGRLSPGRNTATRQHSRAGRAATATRNYHPEPRVFAV